MKSSQMPSPPRASGRAERWQAWVRRREMFLWTLALLLGLVGWGATFRASWVNRSACYVWGNPWEMLSRRFACLPAWASDGGVVGILFLLLALFLVHRLSRL